MGFEQFLQFAYMGGGGIAIVSFLAEKWEWFQKQESENKKTIMFLISTLITVVAYLVLKYVPAETIKSIEPFFQILAGNFGVLLTGKVFHSFNKEPDLKVSV